MTDLDRFLGAGRCVIPVYTHEQHKHAGVVHHLTWAMCIFFDILEGSNRSKPLGLRCRLKFRLLLPLCSCPWMQVGHQGHQTIQNAYRSIPPVLSSQACFYQSIYDAALDFIRADGDLPVQGGCLGACAKVQALHRVWAAG